MENTHVITPFRMLIVIAVCVFIAVSLGQCDGLEPEPNTTRWGLAE